MVDRPPPLHNRGPQALQELLAGDPGKAEAQLRLLTRTELRLLSAAAHQLGDQASQIVRTVWPNAVN